VYENHLDQNVLLLIVNILLYYLLTIHFFLSTVAERSIDIEKEYIVESDSKLEERFKYIFSLTELVGEFRFHLKVIEGHYIYAILVTEVNIRVVKYTFINITVAYDYKCIYLLYIFEMLHCYLFSCIT
jgi:hypothetical protein